MRFCSCKRRMAEAGNIYFKMCLRQYRIWQILRLIPTNTNNEQGIRFPQFFPMLYCFIFTAGTILSTYFSISTSLNSTYTSHIVLNILEAIVHLFFVTALIFAMKTKKNWHLFVKGSQRISHITATRSRGSFFSTLAFASAPVTFLAYLAVENYLDIAEGAGAKQLLVANLDHLIYILKAFSVIFMICATKVACSGYSYVLEVLEITVKRMISTRLEHVKVINKLMELDRLFGKCSDYVAVINSIFGWPMVFIFLVTIIRVLGSINLVLFQAKDGSFQYRQLSKYCVDVIFVIYITWLVMTCDNMKKTSASIISCYYTLQRTLPSSILKEDLLLLAQCATEQNPDVSAAGFFDVDRTLLVMMFYTLTTHLIVCIQFNMYV